MLVDRRGGAGDVGAPGAGEPVLASGPVLGAYLVFNQTYLWILQCTRDDRVKNQRTCFKRSVSTTLALVMWSALK